jgi:hypothetical protein
MAASKSQGRMAGGGAAEEGGLLAWKKLNGLPAANPRASSDDSTS